MASIKVVSTLAMFVMFVVLQVYEVHGNPISKILEREKRVSDQRLAELETLIALSKMKGKLVTVPIAWGIVDPAKIGRRRRSVQTLLRQLTEDDSSEYSDESDRKSLTADEDERIERKEILLNLLFNDELRKRHQRSLPIRLPAD